MSTTYYYYREKYFCRGTIAGEDKDKIFLANWIEKQIARLSLLPVTRCY
jgi:hypothetical protein